MGFSGIFKLILIIIALVMAIIQFSYLTSSYRKMEVINDLHLKVPDSIQLPAVTICAPYPSLIKYDRLKEKFPGFVRDLESNRQFNLNSSSYSDFIRGNGLTIMKQKMGNQFTVKELFSVSYTEDEFAQIMFIPSPETFEIIKDKKLIEKRCRKTMFLKDSKTCITFNCFKESEDIDFLSVIEGKAKGSLLALKIDQKIFEKLISIAVLVHSSNTLPHGLRFQAMNIATGPETLVNPFSYRKYEYHLLPAPYASNCKNYMDYGYESQVHNLEDCENRLSRRKFGFPFPNSIRFKNDSYLIEPDNKKFKNESNKIRDKCLKMHSQPDCILQDYIPVQYPTVKLSVDFNSLLLKVSREPDVIKFSVPKSSFINYICSVCGTFAFWSIIAIFGILVVNHFSKSKNEKKITPSNGNNNNNSQISMNNASRNPSLNNAPRKSSMKSTSSEISKTRV